MQVLSCAASGAPARAVGSGGMGRTNWTDVPATLRGRIEGVLGGAVVSAASQAAGWSPGSADRVVTADGRRAFVKTISRGRNPDGFGMHRREAAVMAQLPEGVQAPALVAVLDEPHDGDDWVALVLDDVEGRHPGSGADDADTTAVLDALDTLPLVPAELSGLPRAPVELAPEFAAWDRLVDAGLPDPVPAHLAAAAPAFAEAARSAAAAVGGDHLVHLDCRADNLLVDRDGLVWVIDWPWAGVGAHWLDPLTYLLDALVRGEDTDVEQHLRTHRVFRDVRPGDVDAVLAGLAGLFLEKATAPPPPNMPTIRDFQLREGTAAGEWLLRRWDARTT